MTQALAVRPQSGMVLEAPAADEWEHMLKTAQVLVDSRLLPFSIKTANQAVVIFLRGRELGWPPMAALDFIDPIEGRARVNTRGLLALAYRNVPGFAFDVVEYSADACTVKAMRAGGSWQSVRFTLDDAKRANVMQGREGMKPNWKNWTADMLKARATTRVLNIVCPDALLGMAPEPGLEDVEPPATPSGAEVLEDAAAALAAPPTSEAPDERDYADAFRARMKELGWKPTGPNVIKLLDLLGVPRAATAKDMLPGAWKVAFEALCAKYPGGSAAEPAETVSVARQPEAAAEGTTPTEGTDAAAPALDDDDAPAPTGPSANAQRMRDALDRLQAAYPAKKILTEHPAGSGEQWIAYRPLVVALLPTGEAPRPVRLAEVDDHQALTVALEVEAILKATEGRSA